MIGMGLLGHIAYFQILLGRCWGLASEGSGALVLWFALELRPSLGRSGFTILVSHVWKCEHFERLMDCTALGLITLYSKERLGLLLLDP
jgi:hypothetical protein